MLRRTTPVLLGCCLAGLAGPGLLSRPVDGAPVPKERPDREVRLETIYTTADQNNLRWIRARDGSPEAEAAIRKALSRSLVSNLFLVRGEDVAAALRGTRACLAWDAGAEKPADREARWKSKKWWLFVYLGQGPSVPPEWTIEGVAVYGRRVVVHYRQVDPFELRTKDNCQHAYWVPLGELKAGEWYTLELLDEASKEVTLLRREKVEVDE